MGVVRHGPLWVVIEGPQVALEDALLDATNGGWTQVEGFAAPYEGGDVVRTGAVDSEASAQAALLAALAGQGLVVRVTASREVTDRLVDDLRRLGPVDHRIGLPVRSPGLGRDARAILGLLAEGRTLGEAADFLGLSRRTADRRLAEGRAAMGVTRTTEAIARARRLGWLDLPRDDRA